MCQDAAGCAMRYAIRSTSDGETPLSEAMQINRFLYQNMFPETQRL